MRLLPTKDFVKKAWDKYGLIVVGNIVFFILLYFISYRPANNESRAAELLSMAQEQETIGRNQAALVLYERVNSSYASTRAAKTAKARLPVARKLAAAPVKKEPELIPPRLDLEPMLSVGPSVYLAKYLAAHYDDDPALTPKIREQLIKYLKIAVEYEEMDLGRLRKEREFQSDKFQKELFTLHPKCVMESDWIYDNFRIENANFYSWHNANISVTVTQGKEKTNKIERVPLLRAGDALEIVEFRVKSSGGVVNCKVELTSEEGSIQKTFKM